MILFRPLFSQGDVAVGRITRLDVAQVLVSVLDGDNAAAAAGKTMEVLALSGTTHTHTYTYTYTHMKKCTHEQTHTYMNKHTETHYGNKLLSEHLLHAIFCSNSLYQKEQHLRKDKITLLLPFYPHPHYISVTLFLLRYRIFTSFFHPSLIIFF